MRNTHRVVIVALFVPIAVAVMYARSWGQAPPATKPSDVSALRQERVDTLVKASENSLQLYTTGLGDYFTLSHCDELLAEARMDAASTPADRLAALQTGRDLAARHEAIAQSRFKSGHVTDLDVQLSHADLLRAEIRLAETNAK